MSTHFENLAGAKLVRVSRNSLAPFVALLTLIAVFASLVPCETTPGVGSQTAFVAVHSDDPTSSNEPARSCADNCPCLCAGSCPGALASYPVGLVVAEHPNELNASADTFIARLIPERHFRPPRLDSVV